VSSLKAKTNIKKQFLNKMANLINEAEIRDTWSPIIESATGINDASKLAWMSEYCHNHKLYEDAAMMSLGTAGNIFGMGAVTLPGVGDGSKGSGDKSPTLLPLAMQVAAQTIGLDLVPVIPMAGPMGLLSYLDFVYEGGKVAGETAPTYIKASAALAGVADIAVGSPAECAGYTFIGKSRIDGKSIFKVGANLVEANVADDLEAAKTGAGATVELVKALEDHIPGFSGSNVAGDPFTRGVGEQTNEKIMGLSLFSKAVEAKTFQVAAAVTREQVQDLKQFGVDAVAQVEAVLVNELTQNINDLIINNVKTLGEANITNAVAAGEFTSGALNVYLLAAASLVGGQTEGSEHRKVLTGILAAANLIANRGRRGAGNFAVVGPQVATVLQAASGFVPNPFANTISQSAGAIYPVGSIAGIQVYTNPKWAWNYQTVLVGRKGDGNGPGLVFMPYLMAESVQTIAEGTMAPKIAVKSRFALVEAGFHPETQYVAFEIYKGTSGTTRFSNLLNLV
jgi:hypothetical protein